MRHKCVPWLLLAAGCVYPLRSQERVDPRNTYERLFCVVPLVGNGSKADPRRPMYAPAPGGGASRDGILGWVSVLSDDRKFALVEFVAGSRAAFQPILQEQRPDVKVFEKGKAKRDDIEKEFRKYRKDFSLDSFEVRVP